ncbi:glutamate mutase epsilon subunit [Pelotomaculum thermopropionicum SI]|uniref:Glutamate mutase epsilon subunit n=1 Tax=Pelotomaculum thermopropionicum (strain DSM 13744 / JCM 10971 / SI) TaxID=370438 RepID=A5CZJ8_PELTS|nr:glutamate mutase epsilon subunit [Pelotomaculum thermopropionicum SI]
MIRVRQKQIDWDKFLEMRKEVLSVWPTLKEIDLEDAVAYQKSLPESKIFYKQLQKLDTEKRMANFPRAGTPILEDEIELVRTLNSLGVICTPLTTDSYTRNLQFEKAQQGLEESIRTGKPKLNGYPIINHGLKNNRKLVESVDGCLDPRCSRKANSQVAEMAFASGMNAMPCSFFAWFGGYDKKATIEECIETAQYMGRLMGYYAENGVIINADCHGWLPNGVIPMSVNIATQIIEALIVIGQGAKCVMPQVNLQGCLAQDLADIRTVPKLYKKYIEKLGYKDIIISGVVGSQVPLYPYPQDVGSAFGYSTYTAMVAALGKVPIAFIKTIDEALGVPSTESHVQTYKACNWIFNVIRTQDFEIDNEAIRQEEKITEAEVTAILDKVLDMGDGDVAVGAVKAVEAGVLDSPFSISIYAKDKVLGIRDLNGACRYLEFGNLPIPEDIKDFHRQKVAERAKAEGREMNYKVSLEDFWAISKGQLIGKSSLKK